MSESVLDFDEVAADDALIESLRAGADADELVTDDAAVGVLLSLRDGAEAEEERVDTSPVAPGRAVITGVITHRRSIAASVVAGILATAGVGTAVAGDPTAAFTYMFRQGVELGGRLGTPESNGATGPMRGIGHAEAPAVVRSVPVRQGSAAAEVLDNGGTRAPMGFQRDSQYWTVPAPRGLTSLVGNGGDSARQEHRRDGVNGFADTRITDRAARPEPDETPGPQQDEESTTPPDEHGFGTETDTDSDTDTTTEPPPDEGTTTLIQPPPETTEPPPETTTPPPETTTSPPPETTSPPPETTTSPPPETTTPPPETTDEPPSESSSPSSTPSAQ